jgi:hypothetical protein
VLGAPYTLTIKDGDGTILNLRVYKVCQGVKVSGIVARNLFSFLEILPEKDVRQFVKARLIVFSPGQSKRPKDPLSPLRQITNQ